MTKDDLKAFEKRWGLTLPKEFIGLYLESNGGYPPFDAVAGEEHVYDIDWFLPIKYGNLPIDKILQDNRDEGIDMKGMIPFAADEHDNLFVLSLSPSDYGNIYVFGQEDGPGEPSSYQYVCGSFAAFLEGLTNDYQDE